MLLPSVKNLPDEITIHNSQRPVQSRAGIFSSSGVESKPVFPLRLLRPESDKFSAWANADVLRA